MKDYLKSQKKLKKDKNLNDNIMELNDRDDQSSN